MTIQELQAAMASVAEQVLDIPCFDTNVTMTSTPSWDSLRHIQLLSAVERKFGIEIKISDAFKLTSAEKLFRYLQERVNQGTAA